MPQRAPEFLATALPGLDPTRVRFVPHHVAHAASAGLAAPFDGDCAVLVLDGRGERHSHLGRPVLRRRAATRCTASSCRTRWDCCTRTRPSISVSSAAPMSTRSWRWPRTASLDISTSCGSSSTPRATAASDRRASTGTRWRRSARPMRPGPPSTRIWRPACRRSSKRCCSIWPRWLHDADARPGTHPGRRVWRSTASPTPDSSPRRASSTVWVQPAAGDAGTALGGALYLAQRLGDSIPDFPGADLGREWSDEELEAALRHRQPPVRPTRRHRRRGSRGTGRRRHRRLVPGPQRIRSARAGASLAAGPSRTARAICDASTM